MEVDLNTLDESGETPVWCGFWGREEVLVKCYLDENELGAVSKSGVEAVKKSGVTAVRRSGEMRG